jgi:Flp pilus assembly protein TadD
MQLLRIARSDPDLADPEAAVAAAKKAVALTNGEDPAMLKTLALAFAENDEPEEAVKVCEKALKLISKQEQPDAQLKDDLEASLRRFKRAVENQ